MSAFLLYLLLQQAATQQPPVLVESIVVSGIRADAETPVTKTDIKRERIEKDYYGQDIPLLLRDTPSINAYAESGTGSSGYSYISLRGVGPTRINFTLDGVPLADSEDMGTYFVDFPDLARSLQSIQIQRGVGTSTVGSPSFGGSVNLESIDVGTDESTSGSFGVGSFGTRQASVGYHSGLLPGGFALYSRLSFDESDGFREHSQTRQRNLFLSAAKNGDRSQIRITGFTGHERLLSSFLAADADTLTHDLRANPLNPEDTDSFGYDLAQVQYLRSVNARTNLTASVYYQRGYGSYRLFDDETTKTDLRQYGLDGMLLGSLVTMSYSRGPLTANYGVHVNRFRREHTRDLVGGPRDYYNYGVKSEANAFAKFSYDVSRWHSYTDLQVRTTDFQYHGSVAIAPMRWTFFNPKVGARFDLSGMSSLYASIGASHREPTRNDLFQGEDNATFAHDLRAVTPERLLDIETGWEMHTASTTVAATLYAMEFHHEIAATGELSDIGLALRRNVDRSYRRGVELEASWQPAASVRLRTTGSVSRNRIRSWTQFYDLYDESGAYIGSEPIVHRNVSPLLTPNVIASQSIDWTPVRRASLGAIVRFVDRSYLDNTNDDRFVTPSFTTVDASAAYDVTPAIRLSMRVNNVFNRQRVYPSGYSYLFITRPSDAIEGTTYFYPQATRNAILMLDFHL
ncbi:MAG: TonB-dependent receptor [Thermoanaerobaculia bacterium]